MKNFAVEAIITPQNSWLFSKNSSGKKKVVIRHNISYDFCNSWRKRDPPELCFRSSPDAKYPEAPRNAINGKR